MKFYMLLLLIPFFSFCQVEKDSIINKDSSWYARSMFLSLTTGSDAKGETISKRMCQNIEFGRTYEAMDIGLSVGQFRHSVVDSSSVKFTAIRVSLDAFQLGRFSNEVSLGAGYVFNSKTPVMLEISSTLFAQIGDQWGVGFVFGNIDFVGNYNDLNKSFFGLYLRFGLLRNEGGFLSTRVHNLHNVRKHQNQKIHKLV